MYECDTAPRRAPDRDAIGWGRATVRNIIIFRYYCLFTCDRSFTILFTTRICVQILLCLSFYLAYACTKVDICQWCRDTNSPGRRPGWPKIAFPRHGVQCSRSIRPVVDRPGRRRLSSSHGPENHLGKSSHPRIWPRSHISDTFTRVHAPSRRTYYNIIIIVVLTIF